MAAHQAPPSLGLGEGISEDSFILPCQVFWGFFTVKLPSGAGGEKTQTSILPLILVVKNL